MTDTNLYNRLISYLDQHKASYRLIDHKPEGRTEIVSPMRGNTLSQAAKCMVLVVHLGKKEIKYVLGVIPGDKKIDFDAVKSLMHASYVSFAPKQIAEELSGSVVGTVLPFSFNSNLELIVDPILLENDELFFNAARLDRSMALKTNDYVAIVNPRLESIAKGDLEQKQKTQDIESLDNLRHSCAHLLAAAVMELYPYTKRTIGPAIENGFYYDLDFGEVKISDSDLPKIEAKMKEIIKTWDGFERSEVTVDEAKKAYAGNPYKIELIDEFSKEGQTLTFFKSGNYSDLCRGGHVAYPKSNIKHFKLLSIAGAYWRGSEKNKMLTRIYGTCFPTKVELDTYLLAKIEAEKRDHRKLGQELDLYSISPLTGQGLILWHPKLAIVRNIVEDFWRKEHYRRGYQLVFTPHIASMDMFVKSRHLSKYINYMFPIMLHQNIEGESSSDYIADEVLKPMNCPNHIQVFKAHPRSYRELPMRIGELGTVYRYERAGVLHGMTRVRGFTQDDSHIFCTPAQVIDEVREVLKLMKYVYSLFGFKDYHAYIATRPEKYLGSLEMWNLAETSLKKAADQEGFSYKIDEGEGVFYGPKIDMKVKDSIGRQWQLGTVQFDFNQPDKAETTEADIEEFWKLKTFRQKFKTKDVLGEYLKRLGRGFDVNYINNEGKQEQCIMIHRVVFGSMERFFGILIEHFAGAFPLWLSPVQVIVLPISEKHVDYALSVNAQLLKSEIRSELDRDNESLNSRIRKAEMLKVPYILIVGDKEIESKTVSIRIRHQKQQQFQVPIEKFISDIKVEIDNKTIN